MNRSERVMNQHRGGEMKSAWIFRRFGLRCFTAINRYTGEYRMYYSWEALETDFGEITFDQ